MLAGVGALGLVLGERGLEVGGEPRRARGSESGSKRRWAERGIRYHLTA